MSTVLPSKLLPATLLALVSLGFGCSDPVASHDSGVDAGVDSGADAGVDSGADAGVDGGVDAGVDGGPLELDAGPVDSGVDAGPSDACFLALGVTCVAYEEAYLKAHNPSAVDQFGRELALSGDTLVVGVSAEDSALTGVNPSGVDDDAASAGAAYVFVRSAAGIWSQQAYLKAANADAGDQFGGSVALDGDTIAIGAQYEQSSAAGVGGDASIDSGLPYGAVYVFHRSGTTWSQQAYVKPLVPSNAAFGNSLALDGDTLVVGMANDGSGGTGVAPSPTATPRIDRSGAVYVFTRSGVNWSQQVFIKAPVLGDHDTFGDYVSISGDTLAVAAPREDSNASGVGGDPNDNSLSDSGAVYVFVRSGTTWTQQAYLKASYPGAGDFFGEQIRVDSNTLAVGARYESSAATGVDGDQTNDGALYAGAVYVFVRSGGTWTQQAYVKASNAGAHDYFGYALAVDGDTMAVGAFCESSAATGVDGDETDDSAEYAGAVYLFSRSGETWSQSAYLKSSVSDSGDYFGIALDLDGDTLAIGASGEDSAATGVNGDEDDNTLDAAGAAYIRRIAP